MKCIYSEYEIPLKMSLNWRQTTPLEFELLKANVTHTYLD